MSNNAMALSLSLILSVFWIFALPRGSNPEWMPRLIVFIAGAGCLAQYQRWKGYRSPLVGYKLVFAPGAICPDCGKPLRNDEPYRTAHPHGNEYQWMALGLAKLEEIHG